MLSPRLRRMLLWDYDRGTVPYDVLCIVLAILLLATPVAGCDPMVVAR